jgi:hypothetical protein
MKTSTVTFGAAGREYGVGEYGKKHHPTYFIDMTGAFL